MFDVQRAPTVRSPRILTTGQELFVQSLSGFSGCEVSLYRRGNSFFVRKRSQSEDYSPRLEAQAQIQATLATQREAPFRVPDVLADGVSEGLYFFDSVFVYSEDAISALSHASVGDVDTLVDRLAATIAYFADHRHPGKQSVFAAIGDKLNSLNQTLGAQASDLVAAAHGTLDKLIAYDRLETSVSHEDLTLENILVDPYGTLWLIDCLDSPHPHYWFSCAKLFQDLEGCWFSLRNPQRSLDVTTRLHAVDRLKLRIDAIDPSYRHVHGLILALQFLRILPYAQSCSTAFQTTLHERARRFLTQSS